MPTLPELLSQLQFISYETALLGLFITAGLILVSRDWRLLILVLLTQYILVGIILSRLVQPDIAVLKVLIGAFICPILFLSARQVAATPLSIADMLPQQTGSSHSGWRQKLSFGKFLLGSAGRYDFAATGFYFRLFLAFLLILITTTLSKTFPLPGLEPAITTAVYWLALAGLVTLTLTETPIKAGIGLFTVLTGFGLYYATLESSLLLIGLLGSVNLMLALSLGYLIVVRGTGPEEGH